MVTYALDASAILRYLDGETGGDRVSEILKEQMRGGCRVVMSAIHWGEVAGRIFKAHGRAHTHSTLSQLSVMGIEIIPATAESAVESAIIKAQKKIPYADAFGVELARSISNSVLITADFDLKPASQDVKIEFLPKK